MLEYEWGNPSTITLTGNEGGAATESGQTHRQTLNHNYNLLPNHLLSQPQPQHAPTPTTTSLSHQNHFYPPELYHHQHHPCDPRAFTGASPTSYSPPPSSLYPIPPLNAAHYRPEPDPELLSRPIDFMGSRLRLNLGGRIYFASSNDDIPSRLYRPYNSSVEVSCTVSSNSPRCQAEGCNADLSDAKHYHCRHKVCEFHSKAAIVIAAGLT
ncbi:SBP domain [Sesbania bispinosa]|nr:SBP domain [Sesbania bispinosa]